MLSYRIQLYHRLKDFIPRRVLIALRRAVVMNMRGKDADIWPIDERAP